MFRPLAMRHVTLYVVNDDLPAVTLTLAEFGSFSPQPLPRDEALPESPGESYRRLHEAAHMRLEKIFAHLFPELELYSETQPGRAVDERELERLHAWLGEVWRECNANQEQRRRLNEEAQRIRHVRNALATVERLDVDLSLLRQKRRFLDVRIGNLPLANLPRLREAITIMGYTLSEFLRDAKSAHVVLMGLEGQEQGLQQVLEAASFHTLELPEELTGHPDWLRAGLRVREARLEVRRSAVEQESATARARYMSALINAARVVRAAAPFAHLAETLQGRGAVARLSGWVPETEVARVEGLLGARIAGRYHLESRAPLPGESVPTAQRVPRLLQPFARLVRNYGVPNYGEIDPTWLFALSFVAMFGMMFGDVGHGALIVVGGWLWRRRLKGYLNLALMAGGASMLFGLLYGSVFGFEGLFAPLWLSPLHDPMRLLTLALLWGIGFISLATGLAIRNQWLRGERDAALWGARGVAGLLFYFGLFTVLWRVSAGHGFGHLEGLALALPLGAVMLHGWRESRAAAAERLLVALVEGFETAMNYLSNTLSFLRVAAFSLNHAALAIAVFTLAGMMGEAGHWVTLVLGNLFILVLEGAIVAIQVLRLEYYEGFARFFAGDGRPFRPLTLETRRSGRGWV